VYLLDANVFIQAKNLHYGLDFCPAFWSWLIAANDAGRVFSIEKVGDEIDAVADELSQWAEQRGPGFFLRLDATVLPALGTVSEWATSKGYEAAAVSTVCGARAVRDSVGVGGWGWPWWDSADEQHRRSAKSPRVRGGWALCSQ